LTSTKLLSDDRRVTTLAETCVAAWERQCRPSPSFLVFLQVARTSSPPRPLFPPRVDPSTSSSLYCSHFTTFLAASSCKRLATLFFTSSTCPRSSPISPSHSSFRRQPHLLSTPILSTQHGGAAKRVYRVEELMRRTGGDCACSYVASFTFPDANGLHRRF
jgi:hypothetical protein